MLHTIKKQIDKINIKKNSIQKDQQWVRDQINSTFNDVTIWSERFRFMEDTSYKVVNIHTIRKVLKNSLVAELAYRKTEFDCENMAGLFRHLAGYQYGLNSIGQVYSLVGKHSFNIILTINHGIYVYEPQRELKEGALWHSNENDSKGTRYKIDGQIITI